MSIGSDEVSRTDRGVSPTTTCILRKVGGGWGKAVSVLMHDADIEGYEANLKLCSVPSHGKNPGRSRRRCDDAR